MPDRKVSLNDIDAQSDWYGKRARSNRSMYVWLKIVQLTLAAAVPLIALLPANSTSTGTSNHWANLTVAAFGALVGLIEAVLQLGQYQQNWVLYRGTRETLKSEKRLYVGGIGPYANEADTDAIYIQRCDAVISGEHARWLAVQQQDNDSKPKGQ